MKSSDSSDRVRIACPIALRRRGVETRIVLPASSGATTQPDPALVDLVLRAQRFLAQLTDGEGKSLGEVATANGIDRSDFSRTVRLAFLYPRLIDCILSGTQPVELTAHRLSRLADLPHSWSEQEALLD